MNFQQNRKPGKNGRYWWKILELRESMLLNEILKRLLSKGLSGISGIHGLLRDCFRKVLSKLLKLDGELTKNGCPATPDNINLEPRVPFICSGQEYTLWLSHGARLQVHRSPWWSLMMRLSPSLNTTLFIKMARWFTDLLQTMLISPAKSPWTLVQICMAQVRSLPKINGRF